MTVSPEFLSAFSVIVAAFIAGFVTFIASVLSKDQKTSEFRQIWIDALRQEIADYVSLNLSFTEAIKMKSRGEDKNQVLGDYIVDERFKEIVGIEAARIRILLRLNPEEHKKLILLVNNVYGRSSTQPISEHCSLIQTVEEITQETQRILKLEWKRVKKGEFIFIITKWSSFCIILLICALGLLYAKNYLIITYTP